MSEFLVARLTKKGEARVLDGQEGMTFVVDKFTPSNNNQQVCHVRDYRYVSHLGRDYQIWSLGPEDCEILN